MTLLPATVTLPGEKLHVAFAGSPAQPKVTVPANPFSAVTWNASDEEAPEGGAVTLLAFVSPPKPKSVTPNETGCEWLTPSEPTPIMLKVNVPGFVLLAPTENGAPLAVGTTVAVPQLAGCAPPQLTATDVE